MIQRTSLIIVLSTTLFLSSCIADLRTKDFKGTELESSKTEKGIKLLDEACRKQGMDKLHEHKTYTYTGTDDWKGRLGKTGKLWPNSNIKLQFKHEVGSFYAQVKFLDGKKAGDYAGLQNWKYYYAENGNSPKLQKTNEKIEFGISAYHYFSEMIDRLRSARIVSYMGEHEFNGKVYDKVFCTWNKPEAHREADQYVVWINRETGMTEYVTYTLRESYLRPPRYKSVYGGVQYSNFKEIDGIQIPHKHTIFFLRQKKERKEIPTPNED